MASDVWQAMFGKQVLGNVLFEFTSPTIIASVVFLFLFLLKVKVTSERIARLITTFAVLTFGVYLIHNNPSVFEGPFKNAFAWYTALSPLAMVRLILVTVLAIFTVCAAIDYIRLLLFKLLRVDKFATFVGGKMENCLSRTMSFIKRCISKTISS